MTEYKSAFSLKKQEGDEDILWKKTETQIKIPVKVVPPFKIDHKLSSNYFFSEQTQVNSNQKSTLQLAYAYDKEDHIFNFKKDVQKILETYDKQDHFCSDVPLPTNRKTRELPMTPFRDSNFLSKYAQIHQPEQSRTKWIYIFGASFVILCILLVYLLFAGQIDYSAIFFSTFLLIITLLAYKSQERRRKVQKLSIPQFIQYNSYQFQSSDNLDNFAGQIDYSAMFAKPPTNTRSDALANQSLNTSGSYTISDRATADLSKDQHGKTSDYDISSLKTLGITSIQFNIYLSNFKSFVAKVILSKLVKEMHKDDARIVSMLTVPGYERYTDYTKNRIISLANSHSLAGHFGDKGDRYNEREWTTDFPSDNQIILHILDVWFSNFINGKKKESNNSAFTQNYVFIKKRPTDENKEDAIYLCSDDWSNFYVKAMFKEGKGLQEFSVPSGKDAMYGGLTLFFWFIKKKKKSLLGGADLTEDPINIDNIFSLDRI